MEGSMTVSRLIAHVLATNGIDAAIMTLPHYDARRSADASRHAELTGNIDELIAAVQQAVIDVRRSAQWLADRQLVDADRIGLCGTSLGGFIAALAAGVDGQFPRTALVLAGGDLATVLSSDAKEVSSIKAELATKGITIDVLRQRLEPIEPLLFADRMKNTKLLMINGLTDKIVPAQCASQLADATGTQIHWYKTDHYGMVKYILPILGKISEHFSDDSW
jgi:dienelactone hydrolase